MKNNSWLFFVLTLMFTPAGISAQDTTASLPLLKILVELQEHHGYNFNYASEAIENIELVPPDSNLPLNDIIEYLQHQTGLIFTILPNNFVSIKAPVLKFCGYIKDKISQEPVAFATIQLGNRSTISDENGFFELILDHENDHIRIRHVSYDTFDNSIVLPESGSCNDIYLLINQQILPEIIFSDYLIRGIDKLNNGSFKIDFEKFSILPGLIESDVLQSVQAFPGILSVSETVSNLNIRGGSHDQNLLLWDDIKMYQSGHFFGLISMFNPQITQSVSLRKNGTPAAYQDGVSGTIDMQTEQSVNHNFKGNVGINFIDIGGFLDIPVGKNSSVQIAARKSISEFIETPTYSEYFKRISQNTEIESDTSDVTNSDINFDFYDASLRWIYKPSDKDEIRLNFIAASNELIFNENAVLDSQDISKESSLNQMSIAGGLSYQRTWNDRHSTTLNIYETDYKLKAINANILDDQRFLQENKVSETGVKVLSNYQLLDRLQWTNGYQFVETKITNLDDVDNPIFRKLEAEVVRTHGVFTEIGLISSNRQTNINIGARVNYLEKFDKLIPEPRLSFNHQFLQWFNIEILGEFKHQVTSQVINFQNDFLGIEKRRWQLSDNDTIPIITSKQASAGLSYVNKGWLFNAVGYYKYVDGITTQSQGFQNRYEFIKSDGSYSSVGMDLLVRKELTNVNAWLSYSYLVSEYNFEQFAEKSFPSNFDITHALSIGITYSLNHFRFSTGLNWHTGKPTTRPLPDTAVLNNEVNYDLSNQDRLDDYMRIDLSAIYKFSLGENSRADIGFSIWNLLDRENPINNFYRVNAKGEAEEVVQNSLGITPNAMFRLYF